MNLLLFFKEGERKKILTGDEQNTPIIFPDLYSIITDNLIEINRIRNLFMIIKQ